MKAADMTLLSGKLRADMKNKNAVVTQREMPFPAKMVPVFRADIKGIATYANDAFVLIASYLFYPKER